MKWWNKLTEDFPNILVLIVCLGCTTLAIIDKDYRQDFTKNFAQSVLVGYWAWSQAISKKDR